MKKRNLLLLASSVLLALSMSACTVETGLSQSSGSDSKSSEKQSSEPAPAPSSDASSEQPSSSEAPGPQITDRFYWSLNGSNYLEVDYNTKEDIYDNDHNDIGDQFAITLSSLNAGDVFTFKHNDEQVKPWPDAGDDENINNAKRNDQELIEVIKSSTNTETLYFKYYPVDGFNPEVHGYSLWLTGYSGEVIPPDPEQHGHGPEGSTLVSWYLVGHGSIFYNSWSIDGGIQLFSNPNSLTDKGCILGITFAVGDVFKVTDGTTWYGYEKVDTYESDANKGLTCFKGSADGYNGLNFECTVGGTYDMYVNSSGTFWIQSAA